MAPEGPKAGSQSRCFWSYRQGSDKGLGCSPGSQWAPTDPPAPKAGRVHFPCGKYRNMRKHKTQFTRSLKDEIHLASELLPSSFSSPKQTRSLSLLSEKQTACSRSREQEPCQVPGATAPCCVCEFQSLLSVWTLGHLWEGRRGWPAATLACVPGPWALTSCPLQQLYR